LEWGPIGPPPIFPRSGGTVARGWLYSPSTQQSLAVRGPLLVAELSALRGVDHVCHSQCERVGSIVNKG
jgi:hypothetical protein